MLANALPPTQYDGERQNEDHRNPELQMRTIIRTRDNKQYELRAK